MPSSEPLVDEGAQLGVPFSTKVAMDGIEITAKDEVLKNCRVKRMGREAIDQCKSSDRSKASDFTKSLWSNILSDHRG